MRNIASEAWTYHAIGHAYGLNLRSIMVAARSANGDVRHIRTVTGPQPFEQLLAGALQGTELVKLGSPDVSTPWDYGELNQCVTWALGLNVCCEGDRVERLRERARCSVMAFTRPSKPEEMQ